MKTCADCGEVKNESCFSPLVRARPEKLLNHCKPCHNLRNSAKRAADVEGSRAAQARYRAKNSEKVAANQKKWNKTPKARAYRAKWFADRPDYMPAYQAKYSQDNAEVRRWKAIKRIYGLTQADYDALSRHQENMCAVCMTDLAAVKVHIDHCHASGRIRGLLCNRCNLALGLLRESADNAARARDYLTRA